MSDLLAHQSPFRRRPTARKRLLWNRPRLVPSVVVRPERRESVPYHWEEAYRKEEETPRVLMFATSNAERSLVEQNAATHDGKSKQSGCVVSLFPNPPHSS